LENLIGPTVFEIPISQARGTSGRLRMGSHPGASDGTNSGNTTDCLASCERSWLERGKIDPDFTWQKLCGRAVRSARLAAGHAEPGQVKKAIENRAEEKFPRDRRLVSLHAGEAGV